MPTDARAQFVCDPLVPNPGDSVSCVNTTTENTFAPNSTTLGGQAATRNFGTVNNSVTTTADGGGNATAINTQTITRLLDTETQNNAGGPGAGNATSINSGTVGRRIITQTSDFSNGISTAIALTINSGTVANTTFSQFAIQTQTIHGGDATTINTGTVNGGIFSGTGVLAGGGNALTVNYGKVNGDVTTASAVSGVPAPGNATFINFGTIDTSSGTGAVQTASLTGTAFAYNAGRIYGEFDAFAGLGGSAIISNAGLIDGSLFGTAIDLTQGQGPTIATTLNILPGSRIIGNMGICHRAP